MIVGDPDQISTDALKCGAQVVLPADADGHAPGLERIQDLGVGAMTFPAADRRSTWPCCWPTTTAPRCW